MMNKLLRRFPRPLIVACLLAVPACEMAPTGKEPPASDLQPQRAPGPAPEGMVWIPGGTFWMGTDTGHPEDGPRHRVGLKGFWMDKYEITNAQFAKFVEETGYKTIAERQ